MPKKSILWSPEARADLRAIDRETALRILHAIDEIRAAWKVHFRG
jgi:hypothetical protein